ncbi:acetyl-CoA carboxylase biotin carboxylase subunit [Halalkalibacterium halodurans]|uniref:acetyl-CoA carboxylase biotin carboxylase subunit n=1 Tax=Halalkalibacterium halodurans TaxID=86665 RepID=UPI002E1DD386|nr:acetyl-CoA carboxylase biotin carboxylase subunit [Halalkalibacterium halodurans]
MFKKVLIANRGEIAVRIIRTCQKLNIRTVAIYSEADVDSLHVKHADEAFLIGKPPVAESYLKVDTILEVAKQADVDAIHPGYGLLSENARFARACVEAGIAFIGPSPEVIERMGSKIAARTAMQTAGVPVIPGSDVALADEEEAVHLAHKFGYPVMLKASAGGGGIGMQLVRNDEEMRKAFAGNQKRATSFFGDGTMFLEKAVENPRHIEVQIAADHHGHVVHLWERDCSIQRRHQKVVEEAPSPFVDEALREKIGQLAVKAAKAIDYRNLGTVECLVDGEKNIYFLEMNTRLQVEHPVTEEITGIDLVEWQLLIAAGEQLPYAQHEIPLQGHAIEVRIYAEDPVTFFPAPGMIKRFTLPEGEGIRHEYAISEGYKVTPFYDPMVAKLIVSADTRGEAIQRLDRALKQYEIEGIKTNIPMLKQVINHPVFQAGEATTAFVTNHLKVKTGRNP